MVVIFLFAALLGAAYLYRRSSIPRVSDSTQVELVASLELDGRASAGPAWSPDGSMLAVSTESGQIVVVDADGKPVHTLSHGVVATSLAWSPEASHLATASWGEMKVWRASDGSQVTRMVSGDVYEVKGWTPEDEVVTWNGEESFVSWNRDTGQAVDRKFISIGQQQLVPSPDGRLATWQSGAGGVYTVFSVEGDERSEWPLEGHEGPVQLVAWSPDSVELAGATDSGLVVWDATTGVLDRTLWNPPAAATGLEWNSDGRMLLVLTRDGTATVIDAEDGTEIGASGADATKHAVWHKDGSRFAVVARRDDGQAGQGGGVDQSDRLLILRATRTTE